MTITEPAGVWRACGSFRDPPAGNHPANDRFTSLTVKTPLRFSKQKMFRGSAVAIRCDQHPCAQPAASGFGIRLLAHRYPPTAGILQLPHLPLNQFLARTGVVMEPHPSSLAVINAEESSDGQRGS